MRGLAVLAAVVVATGLASPAAAFHPPPREVVENARQTAEDAVMDVQELPGNLQLLSQLGLEGVVPGLIDCALHPVQDTPCEDPICHWWPLEGVFCNPQ